MLTLLLRTRDDLTDLLAKGKSAAWRVAANREPFIKTVRIYNWDGSIYIEGEFDPQASERTEDGSRLIVAFKNAKIKLCHPPYKWAAQNPVAYLEEGQLKNVEVPKSQSRENSVIKKINQTKKIDQTQGTELERLMRAVQGNEDPLIDSILVHFNLEKLAEDFEVPKETINRFINKIIVASTSILCDNLGRSADAFKIIWFDFLLPNPDEVAAIFITRETRCNSYRIHAIQGLFENPSVETSTYFPVDHLDRLSKKIWDLLQSNLTTSDTWRAFDYLVFAMLAFNCSLLLNSTIELNPAKAIVKVCRDDTLLAFGIEKPLDNSVFLIQDGQEDFFETRSDLMSAVMLYISRLMLHYESEMKIHNLPNTVAEFMLQSSQKR